MQLRGAAVCDDGKLIVSDDDDDVVVVYLASLCFLCSSYSFFN